MSRYRYSGDYDYPAYVSVAEKQRRNRKASDKLRKRDADVQPVLIQGHSIATSWWGKSWNANLERYADYSNRIGRGRSYVRHGAVLDLRINAGTVSALVQGSRSKPYEVTIAIEELQSSVWETLREVAVNELDSLTALLAGTFPKALKDVFFAQGTGLFPAPREISFDCSCPDWASMCKHVAAALYGIGSRLDESPELLFALRQVTVDDLIAQTIDATAEGLIHKAEQAEGDDVLADVDLGDMFGITLDEGEIPAVNLPPPSSEPVAGKGKRTSTRSGSAGAKKSGKKAPSKQPSSPERASGRMASPSTRPVAGEQPRASSPTKRPVVAQLKESARASTTKKGAVSATVKPARNSRKAKPEPGRMIEQFMTALGRSRGTFTVADLVTKLPGWTRLQVTNTLQRAIGDRLVKRVERGVYRRA